MTMTVNSARRILNIAAVIHIICGIPMIVVGILGLSGTAAASVAPEIAESLAEAGPMTAGAVMALSAVILIVGFLAAVEGVLDRRAAKDPAKVMPVWYLSIVLLVINVIGLGLSAVTGTLGIGTIIELLFTALVFSAANSIRKELGK